MTDLPDQQEIMGALADTIIEVFALESCLLRAEKLIARNGEASAKNAIAMTKYYAAKAMQIVESSARKVIAAVAEGDTLRTQAAILRRLAKYEPLNTVALSRQIARNVLAAGKYTI
jgi:butyryl-CoA dehydrogenase